MNRRLLSLVALLIAAVLFVALNIAADQGLRHARLDLTRDHLFTLSQGSRNVLASLKEPIRLRYFYSEKLSNQAPPQLKTYAARVHEMLEEYASLSRGKIRLEVIDPEPFSDAEDRAVQAGVQGAALDQTSGEQFYFGLVGTNSTDKQEVVPFFNPEKEQFLEYDVTKLVYNLSDPKKPVVGVITDLPMEYGPGGMMAAMRGQSQPYALLDQLRQLFQVKMLTTNLTSIDKDVTVLLIAHPKKLTKQAEYAVDQFVLKGGHAMIFVDPFAELEQGQPGPMGMADPGEVKSSSLPELFKAWGIEMPTDKFVGDRKLAIQVAMGGGSGHRQVEDYVAWLALGNDNHASQDVVTSDLGTVDMGTAGSLTQAKGASTKFEPLLWSSDQAALLDVDLVRYAPNPDKLFTTLKPTGERYTLAARVTGDVKTAFPDGPPPAEKKDAAKDPAADADKPKDEPPAPQIKESAAPLNVVVVADSDMLDDRFWVRSQNVMGQQVQVPIASNADFVINAIDNLSGSSDLIGLRSRGRSYRPFVVVDNIRHAAEEKFLTQQQALQKKLDDTQKQIAELESKSGGGKDAVFSTQEQTAVDGFREEMLRTRKQLRDVQHNLDKDIESLGGWLKFINIAAVPIGLAVLALALAGWRYQRRKTRAAHMH